jgi:hypothetical protein
VFGKLVDVALKRIVDEATRVVDTGVLDDAPHAAVADFVHELALDVGVPEMKKVTGVVPDEAVLDDRSTVPADLRFALADEVARVRELAREREPRHARANHQKACLLHSTRA